MDQQYYQPASASFNPLQNFKGFASSRPPLLVFLVCLLVFALTAASLAFVVHTTDLKDPTYVVDWNDVLLKLTQSDVCVHNNNGSSWRTHGSSALNEESSPSLEPTDDTLLGFPDASQSPINARYNHSISFPMQLKLGSEVQALAGNVTTVTGFVCRRLLGFTDEIASEQIRVTVDFPAIQADASCSKKKRCKTVVPVCVTFHGLPQLPAKRSSSCAVPTSNVTAINAAVFTVAQCEEPSKASETKQRKPECDGLILPMFYESNPEWSVFLTEHDRALINLHLMYTSYFLLMMAMTLVCYAIIRGRPKQKMLYAERGLQET